MQEIIEYLEMKGFRPSKYDTKPNHKLFNFMRKMEKDYDNHIIKANFSQMLKYACATGYFELYQYVNKKQRFVKQSDFNEFNFKEVLKSIEP